MCVIIANMFLITANLGSKPYVRIQSTEFAFHNSTDDLFYFSCLPMGDKTYSIQSALWYMVDVLSGTA